MARRPSSFDSISTASDATLERWSEDGEARVFLDTGTSEAIPLHSLGSQGSSRLSPRFSRGARFLLHVPNYNNLLAAIGVLALMFLTVALLPWLAGESKGPVHAPSDMSTTTTTSESHNTTILAATPSASV